MNKNLYEDSIILIGPSGAGKSTVADDADEIILNDKKLSEEEKYVD